MPLKCTIVSPSFNQTEFIGRTLESVAQQRNADIEHIIQDGGSEPSCRAIIDRYVAQNARASVYYENDRGQGDALRRGFAKATGDIVTWLNTDDRYVDADAVADVLRVFESEPDVDVVYGLGNFVDQTGATLRQAFIHRDPDHFVDHFIHSVGILQPSLFFRRHLVTGDRPIDLSLDCAFDYELWVRMLRDGARFRFVDRVISSALFHEGAKTTALREKQLRESAEVTRRYYGYASAEWLNRLADFEVNGVHGILDAKTAPGDRATSRKLGDLLFRRYNENNRAALALAETAPSRGSALSLDTAARTGLVDLSRIIVTTFDEHYIDQGRTMIASVRRLHGNSIPIIVYDLRLSAEAKRQITAMPNTHVVPFPASDVAAYPEFLAPKSYGYKCAAINDCQRFLEKGGSVLWIDAGVAVMEPLDPIFRLIEKKDVFFVDHDDKGNWPFYNGTFCHPSAAAVMGATTDELFGEHLCSCLLGYKVGGKYSNLFADAHAFCRIRDAIVWDKHPSDANHSGNDFPRLLPQTHVARRIASSASKRRSISPDEARQVLGYLGHRQDQTVFSILAARYRAPIQSATKYCRSDDASSTASHLNWLSGSVSTEIKAGTEIPPHLAGAVTYHHRGMYKMEEFRARRMAFSDTLVLLGNGPSLKGFDITRFDAFDTIGMNAAYRYWDQINWYPTYYICLDKVVGLSHADEIARLIRERASNGIRAFFLRQNLIETLPADIRNIDCVFDFDAFRARVPLFDVLPITTGSHSSLFGAILGYKRILLAGIDCNYIEKVEGATALGGTVLEIAQPAGENPNYFFEGYQKVGDKYNIPNSSPDLHLDSWRAVAPVLRARGIKAWNLSAISRVDAFEKKTFEEVLAETDTSPMPPIELGRLRAALQPASAFETPVLVSGDHSREERISLDETAVVARLLSDRRGPKFVMIDVGAHFGTSAAYFDRLDWSIHCFEPDPKNRAKLVTRFGKKTNVSIDPRAVSDKPAEGVSLFTSDESTGISGLHAFRDTHQEAGKVDVTTVADIVEDRDIQHIDFLKIDVEGFDFSVLKGVPWDRVKPDVVECEFEDNKTRRLGHTYKEVAQFLVDQGYTVYLSEWHPIIRYGIRHDWRRLITFPGPQLIDDSWGNILAFRQDPGHEALRAASEAVMERQPGDVAPAPAPAITAQAAHAPVATQAATGRPVTEAPAPTPTAGRKPHPAADATRGSVERPPVAQRVANRLRAKGPLYRGAQLAYWSLKLVRRHRFLVLLALALPSALAWVAYAYPEFRLPALASAAGLLFLYVVALLIGVLGALTRRSISGLRAALDTQNRTVRNIEMRLSSIEGRATDLSTTVAAAAKASSARLGAHDERLANLDTTAVAQIARVETLTERLADLAPRLQRAENAIEDSHEVTAQIARLESLAETVAQLSSRLERTEAAIDEAKQPGDHGLLHIEDAPGPGRDEKVSAAGNQVQAELAKRISQIEAELQKEAKSAATSIEQLRKSAAVYNVGTYQRFNRTLQPPQLAHFVNFWGNALGVETTRTHLGYLAHRACSLESLLKGRLATSIEAITLRSLVSIAPQREDVEILEIGTLFGIGAAAVYEAAAARSKDVRLTVLDPLDGYYATNRLDILIGIEISEATLRQNLAAAQIPAEKVTVIKELSTNDAAFEQAAKRRYDVLIIDGDHSYEGVKYDFDRYGPLMREGGYILFDDYDVEEWPDIKRYVDDEVMPLAHLEFVGADYRTAVFRVRGGDTAATAHDSRSTGN